MPPKDTFFQRKHTINCNGRLLDLSNPLVMGILNVTPDSFYDGGKYNNDDTIVARAGQIISEGGAIIDVGAFSTRPGSALVSEEEEKNRLFPVLKLIKKEFPNSVLSVDTYRSEVAKLAVLEYGADIINDISAGTMDESMFPVIAQMKVPYIMMHIKGTPQNMQQNAVYEDMMKEIFAFFHQKTLVLRQLGVKDIVLDPGFGFSKTLEHNYELLARLEDFKIFELPLLVGVSRKTMIYKLLNSNPAEALNGTSVVNTIALLKGANLLRVHDVKEAVEGVKICTKMRDCQ
jgi:dihydropteroate synthase